VKLCSVCGVVTSRAGSRCTDHARQSNRSRHNALYSTRAWQRLSVRVLRAWRGEHGNWCPGYQRTAHAAVDLTVDHIVPLAVGGAPFDIANTAVLCRSCNSTNGASTGGGVAHRTTPLPPDRARRLCSLGRVSRIIRLAYARAAMDVRTLLRRPSAWLPIAMSLAALGLVMWFAASFGVLRGTHDEGAAARVFQIVMVAQIPIVGYFALTWLPRVPRPAGLILALQVAAGLVAILTVVLLES
jgi:5-methylcytosine-specific restriction endonuclease McrA